MKRLLFYIIGLLLSIQLVFAQQTPSLSLEPQKAEWFKEAKFGMFIHWGLYSILAGTYNGHTLPDASFPQGKSWYAEWIQARFEIPAEEYQALAKEFNPVNFDAEKWIIEAKNAGMRYFVITSKHHDGFALWDTKVSDFNIMNTPFKRDILAELVEACKKHDIKYGFYYSHWQDWEHPQGAMPEWDIQPSKEQFSIYWKEKCLPQVEELIKNFDPDLFWFDTWGTEGIHFTPELRDELIALVRTHSDKCLINGRIMYSDPGEHVDFLEMFDNRYPDEIQKRPWQTPATMTHSWAWHANDFNWKSSKQMLEYLINNTSKGGNYLLNIGPKADGTFPAPAIRRLREMGAWLYTHGEAIYGASPVHLEVDKGLYLSQKSIDGQPYIYVFVTEPKDIIYLPINPTKVKRCEWLETGMPITFKTVNGMLRIDTPAMLKKEPNHYVICISINDPL